MDRGLAVFDRVRMAILMNPEKQPLFSVEERVAIIREAYRGNPRVEVDTFSGCSWTTPRGWERASSSAGIRAISDFEYEFQMALMNRRLNPQIETVFMMPAESYSYVSSRLVKEVFQLGGRVSDLVPPVVERRLREKYGTPIRGGADAGRRSEEARRGEDGRNRTAARRARAPPRGVADGGDGGQGAGAQGQGRARLRLHGGRARPAHAAATWRDAGNGGDRRGAGPSTPPPRACPSCAPRSRIATGRTSSVAFAPEEVTVAVGGKQALALLYQAILDRGSEVVVPTPAWPTFAEAARVAGGTPVFVPLAEKNGFRLTARAVARAIGAEDPGGRGQQPLQPHRGGRGPRRARRSSPGSRRSTASGSSTTTPTPTSCSGPGGRRRSRR